MGVGIHLQGDFKLLSRKKNAIDDWFAKVDNFLFDTVGNEPTSEHFYDFPETGFNSEGHRCFNMMFHPAGERLEIVVPKSGRVTASTKTSLVGPGYHIFVCDLLKRLGEEVGITWRPLGDKARDSSDDTGYFESGDREAVEREMLLHIKTMAHLTAEMFSEGEMTSFGWNISTDRSYEYPGDLMTPLGTRSLDWVKAIIDDPMNGIDIYPWWDTGLTPKMRLGRALVGLWNDVRYREPQTEDEEMDWNNIHLDLYHAYKADPTLNYPWREWLELIEGLNQPHEGDGPSMPDGDITKEIRAKAKKVSKKIPLIGYRRYPVNVNLPDGWSIRIPGEFAEEWDEDLWSSWYGGRTVWFKSYRLNKEGAPMPAKDALKGLKLGKKETLRHKNGKLIGKALVQEVEEDEEILQNLSALSAVDGKAALCNVFYKKPEDAEWAIETWHSLTTQPATKQDPADEDE